MHKTNEKYTIKAGSGLQHVQLSVAGTKHDGADRARQREHGGHVGANLVSRFSFSTGPELPGRSPLGLTVALFPYSSSSPESSLFAVWVFSLLFFTPNDGIS